MTTPSIKPKISMPGSIDRLSGGTGEIVSLLRKRNKVGWFLLLALLCGCAAKDPNKVTPPKTIGETVCKDAKGVVIPCVETK
jgi:hypothetical protein